METMVRPFIMSLTAMASGKKAQKKKSLHWQWKVRLMRIISEITTMIITRNQGIYSVSSKLIEKQIFCLKIPLHKWVLPKNLFKYDIYATATKLIQSMVWV